MFLRPEQAVRQPGRQWTPWMALAAAALVSVARAQGAAEAGAAAGPRPPPTDPALEQYLESLGLHELLAEHLHEQLAQAAGPDRARIADRLGRLYVELLQAADTPESRQRWASLGEELLRTVPEAESYDLRLNLARAQYLSAEEIAERHRLRLASDPERLEAERVLRQSASTFTDIGARMHRRVEMLERREASGQDADSEALRTQLAEARQLRSLAMYYAGWANYYTAMLTTRPALADEALGQFGWLLNASGGRGATVERLPRALLRYEHVARAALGCALCESLRGKDETALRWLEAVERAPDVPDVVRRQIFARRITVLGAAKRWADLEYLVRHRRGVGAGQVPRPLEVAEARLLAVLTLEALDQRGPERVRDALQALAEVALRDLVARGAVGHVLDLTARFGTLPLEPEGFVARYVRGVQAYERARQAHAAGGVPADEPVQDEGTINMYREAAGLLESATVADDAGTFPRERAAAARLAGSAWHYAGDFAQAIARLEQAAQWADTPAAREEALWLAVLAAERAARRRNVALDEPLRRLGLLFLREYPHSPQAARLVLAHGSRLVEPRMAVDILLGVARESPLYEASRRHAAAILHALFRRARGTERDLAALRLANVGEELLRLDLERTRTGGVEEARQALERIRQLGRQVLDVALSAATPDLSLAERVLEMLEHAAIQAGTGWDDLHEELEFRRFQMALWRGVRDEMDMRLNRLRQRGGTFAQAAERLALARAWSAFQKDATDDEAAQRVVEHGTRMLQALASASEPTGPRRAVAAAVAAAAATLWERHGETAMRDLALELDGAAVSEGVASAGVLRRFARLCQAAGREADALDAWRTLLAALPPASPEWFEARYESLRLLSHHDRARAAEALAQFRVLHPDLGPEPWRTRFARLAAELNLAGAGP